MPVPFTETDNEKNFLPDDNIISGSPSVFETELNDFIKNDTRDAIIDLISVSRIDSLFIAILIRFKKKLTDKNRTLILVNPNEAVIRMIEVAGLEEYLLG
jgi:anti-anti-sigma factor